MSDLVLIFLILLLSILWLLLLLGNGNGHQKPRPKLPPGPRALPIIGNLHMLGQLPHRALAKLAQKYGPIMFLKLGHVPTVVVSSPEAAQIFLKQYDATFASRPNNIQASEYLHYGSKGMAFTPYGEYWRDVRKMCTQHLLNAARVEGFEELRRTETEAVVELLKKKALAREVVDLKDIVGELIEQIMFKMVVGKYKDKDDDHQKSMPTIFEEAFATLGAFNLADFIPWLAPLDLQGLTRRLKVCRNQVDEVFESIIDDHLKEEDIGEDKDILGTMLALMKNPKEKFLSSFGLDNVKAIMFDLFGGGIETTMTSITWTLASLFRQPRVMKLVQKELESNIGRGRMVTELDLAKLSYLDSVVKEAMRLYPVGPLLLPHESMDNVIINGYVILKRTRIIVNVWAIGRDRDAWSNNADEFYPERFINRSIDFHGHNFEFIPFGAGRRKCPGIQLGLVTIKLVVAQFIHCFDWELPNGMRPEELDMSEKFGLSMPKATKLLAIPSYRFN